MAIDHWGKVVAPELFTPTHAVGRLSFPLFAALVGIRLGLRPERAGRYARRLLPWAIVSQPVVVVVAGRPWHEGNILFTLLAGVAATVLLARFAEGRGRPAAAAGLVLVAGLSLCVEYGPIGVAIVPLVAVLARRSERGALWATGPAGLAANAVPAVPPLVPIDLFALGSSLVLAASVTLRPRLPRLPTHLFYAFYPAHLLALHLWDLYA